MNLAVRNERCGAETEESGVCSDEGKWGYAESNEGVVDCQNEVIIVSRLLESHECVLFFVFKGPIRPSC